LKTINYIRTRFSEKLMSPGIGLMKRRLEKERDAVSLAISGIANYTISKIHKENKLPTN